MRFEGGQGVFFLTQWSTKAAQVSNEGLVYAFQGITDDDKYFVYAEFSVKAPNLPEGTEPEVISWNERNYLLMHKSKEYQNYVRPIAEKVEALKGNDFKPQLALFEQLISSVEVNQ